ncbi:hypothetical protein PAMP_018181 [Pampus punctatissimus]
MGRETRPRTGSFSPLSVVSLRKAFPLNGVAAGRNRPLLQAARHLQAGRTEHRRFRV